MDGEIRLLDGKSFEANSWQADFWGQIGVIWCEKR
jgi:hypothetical protein